MVLQRWHFDWHNVQFDRSTGWALALAVNAGLLILLSLPLRPQISSLISADPPAPIDWIELQAAPPAPPAPPPPIAPTRPKAVVSEVLRSVAPPQEQVVLVAQPLESVMTDGEPGPVIPDTTSSARQAAPPPGNAEASIDYAYAPLPPYPRPELQRGVEGSVLLRVEVDGAGRVLRVEIEESSGHRRLDRAAQQQVAKHWRFRPATRDGRPVAGWVRVPIEFSLRRG
jgi:protein TonB